LSDFKSVTISAARYQKLSLNPTKLSGQCGRLKCCLNYELETYIDALKDIPEVEEPLVTEKGNAVLQKTDIFRKLMWFGYESENTWHPVDVSRVVEIQSLNKQGKKPATLLEDTDFAREEKVRAISRDLERLDKKFADKGGPKKRKNKKRKNRNPNNRQRPNDKNS
jgi:cell fate regulator YaaT (PSP1 superfamily)